jgi:hypothetical protein
MLDSKKILETGSYNIFKGFLSFVKLQLIAIGNHSGTSTPTTNPNSLRQEWYSAVFLGTKL